MSDVLKFQLPDMGTLKGLYSGLRAGNGMKAQPKSLQKTCNDFESLFINYMMKQMRQTVPQNGVFSGNSAEKLYTTMLDSEMSKNIAHRGGIGLASMLLRQLEEIGPTDQND
ncbi:MAG: flagellar biosynthesis protein FlgJ [Desulfobacteraceae bacterium]|nr:flagellar biosynthesis protein FlgJ [Desulfobacteraceae bacterium]